METQPSGLRKRKSLEDGSSSESVSLDYKPENCKNEVPAQKVQSPERTGPAMNTKAMDDLQDVTVSGLAKKLPAADVVVESQDDLVSEHAKVAEEAISGWEKAEIEAMILKQQLEGFAKKNSLLEDRANHLEGALKEVISKLEQANEKQEMKIQEAVLKERQEWEFRTTELVNQISQLQSQVDTYRTEVSSLRLKLDFMEEENSTLRMELRTQSEELEIRTIERDLSTEAAEKSSKQNLEGIKKVARLETECRRLRSVALTSISFSDRKSGAASSFYDDSLPDSQSESGERHQSVDTDFQNYLALKFTECQTSCSSSDASIRSGNILNKHGTGCGIDMHLLDDFLEIERLAALPEIVNEHCKEQERSGADKLEEKVDINEAEKADLENMLEKIKQQKAELEDNLREALEANHLLEEKVKRIEMEKSELETAFAKAESSTGLLTVQLQEAEMKVTELQKELTAAYETQQSYKSQVMGYELEAKIMSSRFESLESKLKAEKDTSAALTVRCEDMEDELFSTKQEFKLLQSTISSSQLKIKQDDLAEAAGKLAECQQTIASLGIQLKSLASLDELLVDTANSQESIEILDSDDSPLLVKEQHCTLTKARKNSDGCGSKDESPASSSSSSSTSSVSQVSSEKGRNGFSKLFSRSNRAKVSA